MIIENEFGKVNLEFDFDKYKKIGISFSGGADSTLLLYLTFKIFQQEKPDAEIVPLTGITMNKGLWKEMRSQEILNIYLQWFPDVAEKVQPRRIYRMMLQEEYGRWTAEQVERGNIDIRAFGLTLNPPRHIMEKHNLMAERELDRDRKIPEDRLLSLNPVPTYNPFRNVDKRWIAAAYKTFDLGKIFPITVSCEQFRMTPDMEHNENPCGHCWWCREKKMAFGVLDGEEI